MQITQSVIGTIEDTISTLIWANNEARSALVLNTVQKFRNFISALFIYSSLMIKQVVYWET